MILRNTKRSKIRAAALCLAAVILLFSTLSFVGCGETENDEVTVVCTVFPIYDWVRQVVGDTDGVRVVLLVDNGGDVHSFQPTAKDAITLRTADLIVRAGGADDGYAEKLIEKSSGTDLPLMEVSGVTLHCPALSSEQDHGEHGEHDHHDHEYDGHIWLSLKNAAVCAEAIRDALSQLLPEKAEEFTRNAQAYKTALNELDNRYSQEIEKIAQPRLVVADRSPFVYLTEDYGISYEAAFEGCTTDAEAGFDTVLRLATRLDAWELAAVAVCENSDGRLAEAVAKETGREIETVTLHSMQSVSGEEISSGKGYLQIMEDNLSALIMAMKIKEK